MGKALSLMEDILLRNLLSKRKSSLQHLFFCFPKEFRNVTENPRKKIRKLQLAFLLDWGADRRIKSVRLFEHGSEKRTFTVIWRAHNGVNGFPFQLAPSSKRGFYGK
jgi:hypothetical protein